MIAAHGDSMPMAGGIVLAATFLGAEVQATIGRRRQQMLWTAHLGVDAVVSRTAYHVSKRIFDFVLAMAGLVIGAPVMAAASVAIRLESKGAPIFAQTRVGALGRTFTCYKLRTMYAGTAHVPTHQMQTSSVTPVGALLRRWKIDEVPQLYNVLVGDMSLVGPRPCLPSQARLIEERERLGVHRLLPGITGLAQVRGIDMSDPEKLAAVDAEYARSATFLGDLKLVIATAVGQGLGVDQVRRSGRGRRA